MLPAEQRTYLLLCGFERFRRCSLEAQCNFAKDNYASSRRDAQRQVVENQTGLEDKLAVLEQKLRTQKMDREDELEHWQSVAEKKMGGDTSAYCLAYSNAEKTFNARLKRYKTEGADLKHRERKLMQAEEDLRRDRGKLREQLRRSAHPAWALQLSRAFFLAVHACRAALARWRAVWAARTVFCSAETKEIAVVRALTGRLEEAQAAESKVRKDNRELLGKMKKDRVLSLTGGGGASSDLHNTVSREAKPLQQPTTPTTTSEIKRLQTRVKKLSESDRLSRDDCRKSEALLESAAVTIKGLKEEKKKLLADKAARESRAQFAYAQSHGTVASDDSAPPGLCHHSKRSGLSVMSHGSSKTVTPLPTAGDRDRDSRTAPDRDSTLAMAFSLFKLFSNGAKIISERDAALKDVKLLRRQLKQHSEVSRSVRDRLSVIEGEYADTVKELSTVTSQLRSKTSEVTNCHNELSTAVTMRMEAEQHLLEVETSVMAQVEDERDKYEQQAQSASTTASCVFSITTAISRHLFVTQKQAFHLWHRPQRLKKKGATVSSSYHSTACPKLSTGGGSTTHASSIALLAASSLSVDAFPSSPACPKSPGGTAQASTAAAAAAYNRKLSAKLDDMKACKKEWDHTTASLNTQLKQTEVDRDKAQSQLVRCREQVKDLMGRCKASTSLPAQVEAAQAEVSRQQTAVGMLQGQMTQHSRTMNARALLTMGRHVVRVVLASQFRRLLIAWQRRVNIDQAKHLEDALREGEQLKAEREVNRVERDHNQRTVESKLQQTRKSARRLACCSIILRLVTSIKGLVHTVLRQWSMTARQNKLEMRLKDEKKEMHAKLSEMRAESARMREANTYLRKVGPSSSDNKDSIVGSLKKQVKQHELRANSERDALMIAKAEVGAQKQATKNLKAQLVSAQKKLADLVDTPAQKRVGEQNKLRYDLDKQNMQLSRQVAMLKETARQTAAVTLLGGLAKMLRSQKVEVIRALCRQAAQPSQLPKPRVRRSVSSGRHLTTR